MTGASPSDPFALVGKLLDRKYRVDRVVAEGGFGIVYAGHHLALDAPVAVKALKWAAEVDADERAELMACFLLEAKIIARLRHPHVVSVLDAGVAQVAAVPAGVPWMVLEWLDGETLHEHLNRWDRGARSPRACLELMRPVLTAMAHAHQLGIVHCDLKASNILILPGDAGPTPKILDFGIAKIMEAGRTHPDQTTASRSPAFSAVCAAPEQISGARTGPWTDVHALGLLLTRICTGEPPYPENDPVEHHRAVFDKARPTPARFGVDAGAWEPVLQRALALRGGDRHANAGELLAALESALESGDAAPHVKTRALDTPGETSAGASENPPGIVGTARRKPRRRWQLLAFAAAGLGAATVLLARWNGEKPPSPAPTATEDAAVPVIADVAAAASGPDPASLVPTIGRRGAAEPPAIPMPSSAAPRAIPLPRTQPVTSGRAPIESSARPSADPQSRPAPYELE